MTRLSSPEMLTRLGSGHSIADVCAAAGVSRVQFVAWWRTECRRRVPATEGVCRVRGPRGRVEIRRDRWGMPHVFAESDGDLFFGFGYAVAQDRLCQLDLWRRKARGRLAEILGQDALDSDILYRTLGMGQAADTEWVALPGNTRELIAAYSAGVNETYIVTGILPDPPTGPLPSSSPERQEQTASRPRPGNCLKSLPRRCTFRRWDQIRAL